MFYKIILLGLGLFCFMIAVLAATAFPPASLIFGFVAGYCFLRAVFWPMADKITGGVFYPNKKNKFPSFMLDKISAMIAKQNYDEAISELEKILASDPANYTAVSMAAGLYSKKFMAPGKAVECIKTYLESRKERSPDDLDMALMFSDICMENKMHELAIETLSAELKRKYAAADKKMLTMRIEAMKNTAGIH